MPNRPLTKFVCTIGPATDSEEKLTELIQTGMNVARFNTKHGTPQWHKERIERTKKLSKELNASVAILLDLQGPEIRIDLPNEQSFPMEKGEHANLTSNEKSSKDNVMIVPQVVIDSLDVKNHVLLDDGLCDFTITKKGKNFLEIEATSDCEVKHRKSLNTPGNVVNMPSLIPADLEKLNIMTSEHLDYVGLSYVRNKEDIKDLRKELKKRNIETKIISKIENQRALDNIDEIINHSDGIMIARGDLAVEVPFEQLTYWQKLIIAKCREAGKPVITATQMLKSMVDNPRPTRAEVSDVANAIYDGTDAVMLSEETTIGEYPVESLATQVCIAKYNEPYAHVIPTSPKMHTRTTCIARSAAFMLRDESVEFDKIVALTESGFTAQQIAQFRPHTPIHAITSTEKTYRQLSMVFGVYPHLIDLPKQKIENIERFVEKLKKWKYVKSGELLLVIHGSLWRQPGKTNALSIIKVDEKLKKGQI